MNRTSFFVLLILFYACGDPKPSETPGTSINDSVVAETGTEETTEPVAMEIGKKNLDVRGLELPPDFVADSALHALFPGRYADLETDMVHNGIWWICRDCEPVPLYYNYFVEPEIQCWFPDSAFNTTVMWNEDTIRTAEKTYRLLTFFHTQMVAPDFTGRFAGAPTGMALFQQQENKFVLQYFEAAVGIYGSFSTPVSPEVVKAGKNNLLFMFTYGNGGPGSEYTEVTEWFIPEKGKFKKVFFDRFLHCSNTCMGEWSSFVTPADTTSENYSDLVITTQGWVDGSCFNEEEEEDDLHYFESAPAELKAKAKSVAGKKEKFYFVLERTLTYNGEKYILAGIKTVFPAKL